jgi:hypothetical protein
MEVAFVIKPVWSSSVPLQEMQVKTKLALFYQTLMTFIVRQECSLQFVAQFGSLLLYCKVPELLVLVVVWLVVLRPNSSSSCMHFTRV